MSEKSKNLSEKPKDLNKDEKIKCNIYSLKKEPRFVDLVRRNLEFQYGSENVKIKHIIFRKIKDFRKENAMNIFLVRSPVAQYKRSKYFTGKLDNGVVYFSLAYRSYQYIIDCFYERTCSIIINIERFYGSHVYRNSIYKVLEMQEIIEINKEEPISQIRLPSEDQKFIKQNLSLIKE